MKTAIIIKKGNKQIEVPCSLQEYKVVRETSVGTCFDNVTDYRGEWSKLVIKFGTIIDCKIEC